MSIWAKELAPNLFDTYEDWYNNYLKSCDTAPSNEERNDAFAYFRIRKDLIDMTDESNKTCEHCHYWDRSERNDDDGRFFRYRCRRGNKKWTAYFQKCGQFKWREDIVKAGGKNDR